MDSICYIQPKKHILRKHFVILPLIEVYGTWPRLHLPSKRSLKSQVVSHHPHEFLGDVLVGRVSDKNNITQKRTYAETVANYVAPRVAPQIAISPHVYSYPPNRVKYERDHHSAHILRLL